MASKVLVLLFCLHAALGQIPSLGLCPDYLPKDDFDVDRFLGKWYEEEKYFSITDIGTRCVVTDYARTPSGRISMSNEVTSSITGVKRTIEGQVNLTGLRGEGKLKVKYALSPISNEQTLLVLDTDYDNYAVIWSCYPIGLMYTQNVWVMTRDRLAPGPILQKAYGALDKFRINRTFFVKTDQEGCALAASELNAINGITGISTVPEALGEEQKQAGNITTAENEKKQETKTEKPAEKTEKPIEIKNEKKPENATEKIDTVTKTTNKQI